MSFLPEEEVKGKGGINLAPMIDFLFLMLAFFASLAVSRVATKDLDIDLVKIQEESASTISNANVDKKNIHISITSDGNYKWSTDLNDYYMNTPEEITKELETQYQQGFLPQNRNLTKIMLKIDKKAPWEPIATLIYNVRSNGFDIKPIYQVDDMMMQSENHVAEKDPSTTTDAM
jgi:biopolymer transport protein ExbD